MLSAALASTHLHRPDVDSDTEEPGGSAPLPTDQHRIADPGTHTRTVSPGTESERIDMPANGPNRPEPGRPEPGRRRSERRRREIIDAVERRGGMEQRVRRVLYGLIAGAIVITLAVAAAWIVHNSPANSAPDSTADTSKIKTPGSIPADQPYFTLGADESSREPVVDVYLDFMCPFCRWFPEINNGDIKRLIEDQKITLHLHMTTLLDEMSTSGDYSTRAANAAACVYDSDPEKFLDFESRLFTHQPEEGSWGLTDDQLEKYASKSHVSDGVKKCITDLTYEQWLHGTVQADAVARISGTPTIFINGELWDDKGELWTKHGQFHSAVLNAGR